MSIRVEISAETTFEFHQELKALLRGDTNMHFYVPTKQEIALTEAVKTPSDKQLEDTDVSLSEVADFTANVDGATQAAAPKRGRPRKTKTPPVTEAASVDATPASSVSAPQEAVGNTSSVPAGHTPPAEGAQEEAAGAEALAEPKPGQPVASPVITQDDVRAKLKAVAEKLGMAATIKIIVDLGYDGAKSKVKDIREEHYAAVVAAADKVLAS